MKTYVKFHSHHKLRRSVIQTIWEIFLKRKLLVIASLVLLIVIPIVVMTFQYTTTSEAAWFDDAWLYRKAIELPSHSANEGNVYVTAPTFDATDATKFQSDCGDLRFTNQNGEKLPYFVVSCNATATIHVQFKLLPAGATTYYMYYGNPSAQNGFSSADFTTAATGLGSQTLATEEKSPAPIAYWKFDEGYGTTAKDSSQNANNGTFGASTAAPVWQSEDQCISGKCLYFDGSNDVVSVANSTSLQVTGDQTIVMWLKPLQLGARRNPIAKAYGGEGTITFEPGNTLNYYWGTGGGNINPYESKNSSAGLVLNQWNQIALVRNIPANTITWYINGRQTSQGVPGYAAATASTLPLTIGSGYAGAFMGFIDEVKVYSYARTFGQIKADFALKGSGSVKGTAVSMGTNAKNSDTLSKGLSAYWKSDEASGNGVDSSGNANATTVSGTNNYGTGKFGNGLRSGVLTTNLEQNPSLETNLTGWGYWNNSGTATVTQSNEQARFGSYSYKQIVTSDGNQGVYSYGANITEGNTYTMSFWVNITSIGAAESIPFYYRVWHSTGNYIIGTIATLTTTTNGWARYSMTQTIPTNGYTGNSLRLSFYTNKTGTTIYVDGVQIEQSSNVTPYVDGSLGTGYSWSGTAHASTSTRTASAATNATLLNNTSGSLSFWFNSPSLDTSAQCPLGSSDGDTTGGLFFGLKNTGIYLTHQYAAGQTVTPQSVAAIGNSTWNHVAYTWDNATRQGNLYVNGALQQNVSYPQAITIGEYIQNLGTCTRTGYTPFNGILDDIRDYNRALSGAEVSKLYTFAPGPLGYWNFEEGSGNANDVSGNGYTGVSSGTTAVSGKYGKARRFNGSSDVINITDNANLRFGTGNFTVESWIKFPLSGSLGWEGIVTKGYTTGAPANTWGLVRNSTLSNGIAFQDTTDGGGSWNGDMRIASISDGWHHFAALRSETSYKMYMDGILTISQTKTVVNLSTTANIKLGSDASNRYLSGSIDETKIYNYARTSRQIIEDMNAGHPLGGSPVGSQVAYYKFDEGYGTALNNSGNAGSAINSTIVSATRTNEGKYGKGIKLSGAQYIYVPDNSLLDFGTGDFTISTWIKTGTVANNKNLFNKGAGAGTSGWRFGLLNGVPDILVGDTIGWTEGTLGSTSIADDEWHHLVVVYNRNGNAVGYVDGKQVGVLAISTRNGSVDNASNLKMGGSFSNFEGLIDDVKFYTAALSADEIKLDYNRGSAMVLGTMSDTSGLSGGSIASSSASAAYCIPGDTTSCNSPVGEWNFEERTGTIAYDKSGNNRNITLSGSPIWSTGKIGSSLQFEGSPDTASFTDPGINGTNTLSIEFWMYNDSSNASWENPFSFGGSLFRFETGTTPTTDLDIFNPGIDSAAIICTGCIASDTWQHISFTSNSSNWYLYVNGVQKISGTTDGTLAGSSTIYLGTRDGSAQWWKGKLDGVKLYSYARTPAQIAWDYNRGGPVGWWKMDECQGIAANDSSGNGNSGTITIGATGSQTAVGTCTTSGTAWYNGVTGKYNSSLNFDGLDDYVNLGNPNILNNITTKTISFWTYLNAQVGAGGIGSHWLNKGDSSGGWFVSTDPGNSRNIYGQHFGAGTAGRWSFPQFSISQWHHVVVTYDRSSTANNPLIYVDGILQTVTRYSTPTGTAGDDSANSLLVSKSPGFDRFVAGQIDDVRVYNYALTPVQIKQVYNQGGGIRFGPATGSP